jgi:hypothetical protein
LGAVRGYREWVKEQAEVNAVIAKRQSGGFAGWLNSADLQSEPWPFAMIGSLKRPVDAWATIRGELSMGRSDVIRWLDLDQYLAARKNAALEEARAADRAANMALAKARSKHSLTGTDFPAPVRIRPRP